jgi:hypothetical protein
LKRIAAAAILLTSCGHSQRFSMDGTWMRSGISGDHFGIVVLAIKDDGGPVTGTACRTSSGHLVFRDVPLSGHNPYVSFEALGGRYTGGIISEEVITGSFQSAGGSQEWTFHRTPPSEFEACERALP